VESAATTFAHLTLLVAAGLLGPLLGLPRRFAMPVIIGELVAGAVIGRTGLGIIDPDASAFPTLYAVGFAMLMFSAGTHVDITSPALRSGAARGALALLIVFAVAIPIGWLLSAALGVGNAPLFIVLLAGSSAAIAFPIIEERHLAGPAVSFLIAWIALADSSTVVIMPLTLTGASKLAGALGGDALILVITALALALGPRVVHGRTALKAVEAASIERGWALQVRLSVLLLLTLSMIAALFGASTLLAGFAAGAILVRLHESGRLTLQLTGLANGFFVPIFFVLLGARLDLRALFGDIHAIGLALGLVVAAVVVHLIAALIAAGERRIAVGLAASAQLGLPAAAASLALAAGALKPAFASAIVAAACLTLLPSTIGALRLGDLAKA
jgi:Kef-type K+ transport system membrane component KefB